MKSIKGILSVILTVIMLVSMIAGTGVTLSAATDGYIEIRTIEDLYNVRNDLTANYVLMNDIDLTKATASDGDWSFSTRGWNPIGSSTVYGKGTGFSGIFDGNGKTIKGMRIAIGSTPSGAADLYAGLFAYINGGTVKDLTFDTPAVSNTISDSNSKYSGVVAGYISGAAIENVNIICGSVGATGDNGAKYVGAVTGYAASSSIINCHSSASVSGYSCYTYSAYVGGVVGYTTSVTIDNCSNTGSAISGSTQKDYSVRTNYTSWIYCSGIAGYAVKTNITKSYNTTDISVNANGFYSSYGYYYSYGYAAGIAYFSDTASTVTDCYNTGDVKITEYEERSGYSYAYSYAYGLCVGGVTTDCYNVGTVTGTNVKYALSTGTVNTSYYLSGTGNSYGGAMSLTAAQMKLDSTYTGFDFTNTWIIDASTDYKYPQLRSNRQTTDKGIDAVEFVVDPDLTVFRAEDAIVASGAIAVYYQDYSYEIIEITEDMLSGYDMSVVGTQTVTVNFKGHTLTYDITVIARPEATEVILLSGPNKTEFVRDTAFDFTGAKAKIIYSDGSYDIVDITPDNTTGADISKSGTYTVVYEYKGLSVSFTVKVSPVKIVALRVESMPDTTEYLEGEELDTTGLVVVAEYNNGTVTPVSGYTVNYSNEAGEQTVTVKYQVYTCTFKVTFNAISAQTLEIASKPLKTVYFEGESFDPTGLELTASYTDGRTETVSEYTYSDITVISDDGSAYVTVYHDGASIDIPLHVHVFGEWYVYTPAGESTGEERRDCKGCDFYESREISNEVSISINNYWVYITGASDIKDMRYAPGEHTTTNSIRNDPNNVALSNKVVTANTVNGTFCYNMPKGGYFTIWIRMNDGTNHILPLDLTHFTPSVTAYGVKLTMRDLYDVKDIFIAKGEHNTYNEIKDNGYIVRLTENKIGDKHNYTYTVTDPGMHTVLIRYNDGTSAVFHKKLVVTEPSFTTNGLQVTVDNIDDVKVIRTAYGEYYTPGDTKRAEGARNFSSKVIGGAKEYMLQYREEGRVTIVVEYNNGYIKVFHYDVTKKTPAMEHSGNTVTFSELDGFVMIRYAEGKYTTSNQIKKAAGSKVCKPADMIDGKINVTLEKGTYTFCVQYDDDSYNYYIVTVE